MLGIAIEPTFEMQFRHVFVFFLSLSFVSTVPAISAASSTVGVIRTYPQSGAAEVSSLTGIGITSASAFDQYAGSIIRYDVIGASSGLHAGSISYSADLKTVIFKPVVPFGLFERVSVYFSGLAVGGSKIADTFSFVTERAHLVVPPNFPIGTLNNPPDVPGVKVSVNNNPTPGRIFLATYGSPQFSDLMILNEQGQLQKSLPAQAMNFQLQPNGTWTYFDGISSTFIAVDSNFKKVHTYACANGVATDLHELLLSPDGSYSLIGIIRTTMDMRQQAAGGDSASIIVSNVLQRFDKSDALVFEWRGIDHYSVLDANHEDLKSSIIDYEHANSIDQDESGNYLLSNRNLSEITKIDAETGAILWRFGGLNNQFAIQNDTLGFSYQHDVRLLPHGHLTMFDNGNFHGLGSAPLPPESRAAEYYLDEKNRMAWLVWQFHHNPPVWSPSMGSVQRLPNENTFIGWGQNMALAAGGPSLSLAATEVTTDDSVVFEMYLDATPVVRSYRALKYPAAAPLSVAASHPALISAAELTLSLSPTSDGYSVLFHSEGGSSVRITFRDILGREVKQIYEGAASGLVQGASFATEALANGLYYCVLNSSTGTLVRPILLGK